jgi:hypothetical protein
MPVAQPPQIPKSPAPVGAGEAAYIKQCVHKYYGKDAVVRNYRPDPQRLSLHVETDTVPGLERYERLGLIMCVIERDHIGLEVTKRGQRIRGSAKIAYRQGHVL